MNGKSLSFHLFKRVEKKNFLTRIRDYCPSTLSPRSFFSSSSSSSSSITLSENPHPYDSFSIPSGKVSNETTGSISKESSLTEELFTTVPMRWTFQNFTDVSAFIQDNIDNTGTFDETSKTALMIQQCHSVIVVEDAYYYSEDIKSLSPDRLVVAAVIVSNENALSEYNNISLNEAFENPVKKVMVDAMIFNDSIKISKRRILAMIIIHHLVQLCKVNEIASINASSNDETFQYFLDSGFSHSFPIIH